MTGEERQLARIARTLEIWAVMTLALLLAGSMAFLHSVDTALDIARKAMFMLGGKP